MMTQVIDRKTKQVLMSSDSELAIRDFIDTTDHKVKVVRARLCSGKPDNSKNYCSRGIRISIGKGTRGGRMPKAPKGSNMRD